jgi:hypothetical protein
MKATHVPTTRPPVDLKKGCNYEVFAKRWEKEMAEMRNCLKKWRLNIRKNDYRGAIFSKFSGADSPVSNRQIAQPAGEGDGPRAPKPQALESLQPPHILPR